jgi:hypothetical protein
MVSLALTGRPPGVEPLLPALRARIVGQTVHAAQLLTLAPDGVKVNAA